MRLRDNAGAVIRAHADAAQGKTARAPAGRDRRSCGSGSLGPRAVEDWVTQGGGDGRNNHRAGVLRGARRDHRGGGERRVPRRLHRQHPDERHDRLAHLGPVVPRQPAHAARGWANKSGTVRGWMESEGRMRSTVARACPLWPASTATATPKDCWSGTPPPTSAAPRSTTSRALSGWIATSSAPCWCWPAVTLLSMNGLRVCEALNADVDDLDSDRGHRTLRIMGAGAAGMSCSAS